MNKVDFVKSLNELVLATADEDVIDVWYAAGVPDAPSEEDFEFIASDKDAFGETVSTFIKLSKYFKEGLNLFGEWYH